ncbi:MAG TPA: hypothetical protein VML55_10390 [Planctomycetaceae bacterium]|nr:hypothetical protein [Planctomycetaceae bacterium]
MLLVLTLLVAIVGMVWPVFERLYSTHRLEQQTEAVRSKLAGTRVRAIDASVIYQFVYEPGGRWFLVIPFEQEAVDASAAGPAAAALQYTCTGKLPEGFEFRPTDLTEPLGGTLPQEVLAVVPGSIELTNVRWSLPVLFYPDGTATDYAFELYDNKPRRNYMRLAVRGLTGAVAVSDVQQEEQRYR